MKKHNKGKYFFEFWAKLTLEYLFPDQYLDLVKVECPDLQDRDLELGVEVSQIIREQEKKDVDFYYKYLRGRHKDESVGKVLHRFEKHGKEIIIKDSIYHNGDNQIVGYSYDYQGINYDSFKEILMKKLDKLNSGLYENVKKCDLYLIWFDLFDEEVTDVTSMISNTHTNYEKQFRYIYIDNKTLLLRYDISKKKCELFHKEYLVEDLAEKAEELDSLYK